MKPLISIIIPTYNRAHLIGETLDSITNQTYTNWECIIVDDGSTDTTESVIQEYRVNDSRFQYAKRPENKNKGANSCRNHGFEISKGEFINWFDSDDLMVPNFLQSKIDFMAANTCDFLFSNTINFDNKNAETAMFQENFHDLEPSSRNFIRQIVAWSTPDFLCTRHSIGPVRFNEDLRSGQEFNFFSKYLQNDVIGLHLDEVLTKRRIHDESIQSIQHNEKSMYLLNKYNVYFRTYQDIMHKASNDSLNYLLNLAMSKAFELATIKKKIPNFQFLVGYVSTRKGYLRSATFVLSIIAAFIFGSGHALMDYSRK